MSVNFHKILGVAQNADEAEIKKAYRAKAMTVHPDVNPSPEAQKLFIELAQAYEALISGNYTPPAKVNVKKKYWDVYQPPTDPFEYQKWKKVDQERREYYRQKVREETIKSRQTFEREVSNFKKSKWYYPGLLFYYFVMAIFFSVSIGSVCVPIYVKWNQSDYNFSDDIILTMGICTMIVSFTLFYYLRKLRKDVNPYFTGKFNN